MLIPFLGKRTCTLCKIPGVADSLAAFFFFFFFSSLVALCDGPGRLSRGFISELDAGAVFTLDTHLNNGVLESDLTGYKISSLQVTTA